MDLPFVFRTQGEARVNAPAWKLHLPAIVGICAALIVCLVPGRRGIGQQRQAVADEQGRSFPEVSNTTNADALFGLDRVVDVDLRISAEEWTKLQPPDGTRLDDAAVGRAFGDLIGDAIRGGNFRSEKSTRPGLAGYLGVDHQYGQADVTIDGETIQTVGLRYKGNGTFVVGHKQGSILSRLTLTSTARVLHFVD